MDDPFNSRTQLISEGGFSKGWLTILGDLDCQPCPKLATNHANALVPKRLGQKFVAIQGRQHDTEPLPGLFALKNGSACAVHVFEDRVQQVAVIMMNIESVNMVIWYSQQAHGETSSASFTKSGETKSILYSPYLPIVCMFCRRCCCCCYCYCYC
jgi:hypothetical protein